MKTEISEMKSQIGENVTSSQPLMDEIKQIYQENILLQEEIKKTNFSIQETNKEKEDIRTSINILKKHIHALKDKIQNIEYKAQNNMMDIDSLEEQFVGRSKSCMFRNTKVF